MHKWGLKLMLVNLCLPLKKICGFPERAQKYGRDMGQNLSSKNTKLYISKDRSPSSSKKTRKNNNLISSLPSLLNTIHLLLLLQFESLFSNQVKIRIMSKNTVSWFMSLMGLLSRCFRGETKRSRSGKQEDGPEAWNVAAAKHFSSAPKVRMG
ncbi:hypothetical protein ACFX2J_023610 [Malus domestica]